VRRFALTPDRIHGDHVTFDAEESRHLAVVLRLRPGDTILATDGEGRSYTVRLESVGPEATGTVLGVDAAGVESPLAVTLVQSVPKGNRMELIVRATTELGVARVVPAIAERTIVRLEPSRWRERARRWQRVAREATKQSRRAVVPEVAVPRPLAECLHEAAGVDLALCSWEGETSPLASVLDGLAAAPRRIAVLVGPEGGLARREVEAARARGWLAVSLGPRVLRTETAGPALMVILQARFGDLGRRAPS
jgi:16S rRNA (uracil1498-N3)-methyltransferase